MSDVEYERNEAKLFQRDMQAAEEGSLADRQEACRAFAGDMKNNPDRVAENLSHLFSGNYGYGAMKAAANILKSGNRNNKRAQLCHIVAAIGYQCPGRLGASAWKKLSPSEKAALDRALDAEIADELEYVKENGAR